MSVESAQRMPDKPFKSSRSRQSWPAINMEFVGREDAVRPALERIMSTLKTLDLSSETCGRVELVLAEALNNIVEHAYINDTGKIELRCIKQDEILDIRLIDDGRSLPDMSPPQPSISVDTAFEDLPEGGFGWFLIQQLTDLLSYEHREGQNHLNLRFQLSAATTA